MVHNLVALTSMSMAVMAITAASVCGFVNQHQQQLSIRGTATTTLHPPIAVAAPIILSTRSLSLLTPMSRTSSYSSRLALSSPLDDSSSTNNNNNSNNHNNNNNFEPSMPPPTDTTTTNNKNNNNSGYTTNQYHGIELPSADEMENNISELRQLRWEREAYILSKFASGDELQELRRKGSRLRKELLAHRQKDTKITTTTTTSSSSFIQKMEHELLQINERDAEFMYCMAKEMMMQARNVGDAALEEKYRVQMKEAALGIPQLNMHGLWVGKYGGHGYEMINITYSGETLIATKVTGDKNVPKGEITFTVDLSPQIVSSSYYASSSGQQQQQQQQHHHYVTTTLEPIVLDEKAQSQWGKKYLPRFVGKGRVASENFTNAQWMEGQFILVGRFFSFAWVPIGQQIFFGRPSSDLILTMLKEDTKEDMSKRDEVSRMRSAVKDMWEETYWTERENLYNIYDEEGSFA